MSRRLASLFVVVGAACLAGCADDPQPDAPPHARMAAAGRHGPSDGDPSDRPEHEGRAMLFVSPCGEPFRSRPGEPYPVVAWFRQADADHDGQVDRAEFVADAVRFFHVLDRNGDGVIDSVELHAYEHEVVPEIALSAGPVAGAFPMGEPRVWPVVELELIQGGMGGGGGGGHRGGGHSGSPASGDAGKNDGGYQLTGAAPYNLLGEPEPVAASDLSFTGRIALADFKLRAGQRFDSLDPDGRGYLTLDGLPKTLAQRSMRPDHHRHAGAPAPSGVLWGPDAPGDARDGKTWRL